MPPSDATRRRLAVTAVAFGLAAPAAYVLQRLYERATGGVADPLLVVRETHTAFYYRAAAAVWWGSVVALVVWAAMARGPRPESWARRGGALLVPFVLLLLALTLRFP